MLKKSLIFVIGSFHDILMFPIILTFIPISFIFKKASLYRKSRVTLLSLYKTLKKTDEKSILFYCSSVGEFEQSLPIIKKFSANKNRCIIFFHSKNGYDYCKSISNYETYITPFDLFFVWLFILYRIKPTLYIINRHEFWPGAILSASFCSELVVVNYVVKSRVSFFDWLTTFLSKRIFTVNVHSKTSKFITSGDTRLDRLIDKHLQKEDEIQTMKSKIRKYLSTSKKLVVLGNCYTEDLKILMSISQDVFNTFRFLIIPSRSGFNSACFDKIIKTEFLESFNWDVESIIIWNTMGNLFEVYASADLAWVGGGFTKGIHNCLEPDYYKIPIISGPNLNEQPDALFLKKEKRLHIFEDGKQLEALLLGEKWTNNINFTNNNFGSPTELIYSILNENNYSC